jgi:hypothetical protein
MQTLFAETKKRGVFFDGLGMVLRNKRYIFWFWLLDLLFAYLGTISFRENAHSIFDHSLYGDQLVHGFHLWTWIEFLSRPDSGSFAGMTSPALFFAIAFFMASFLFMPGVFAGYASTYRYPREDFFRSCGRNLWRFIRILIISGIIMGVVAGVLFGINSPIFRKAGESTNELLPFETQVVSISIIFLIMTMLRIWFDLAETDAVLNDQRAVRRSIAAGFRHAFRSWVRLLASYVAATIVAGAILGAGILVWVRMVRPESILGAFAVSQLITLLLLIPRFWQRGIAVSYWQQHMETPVAVVEPVVPAPLSPVVPEPPPIPPATTPEPSTP